MPKYCIYRMCLTMCLYTKYMQTYADTCILYTEI